jgi:hypothetical protein
MTTKSNLLDQFAQLRLVVSYLGQAKQSGWWDCNFMDATGLRFLETTFPRTAHTAAVRSTTEAACTVHDKAMGRVGNFHLFRLPPALEDQLDHVFDKMDWAEAVKYIASPDVAMEALKKIADAFVKAPEGPVQVGVAPRILTSTSIKEIAAHYYSAFQDGIRCFPYFASENNGR